MNAHNYTIEIPHFYSLVYHENGKSLTLEIDFRDQVPCIYASQIRSWDAPFQDIAISRDERDKILDTILSYLVDERGFEDVEIDNAS